jgi:hypothetical protein
MYYSKDRLNTMALAFGILFNTNEKKARLKVDGTYAGWFPMIDFGLSHGGRGDEYKDANGIILKDSWTETTADLGWRIPLDLSRGVNNTLLQVGCGASLTHVSGKRIRVWDDNFNGNLVPFHYRLEFSTYRDGVARDVAPRWGQDFEIEYRHTPFHSDYRGSQISSQTVLYFPGMMKHDGFQLLAAGEEQNPDNYLFSSSIPFSRGYDAVLYKKLAHASASYAFPLFYPDFALGSLAYLKRVMGRLFYDYTLGMNGSIKDAYRSLGAEMGFETYFFNLHWPIDLGLRWVYRIEDRKSRIEPIIYLTMP